MRAIIIYSVCILLTFKGFAQTDTIVENDVKGFLFLSNYHGQYDFKGGEVNPLGFHDFFFPVKKFHTSWFSEENMALEFKNGLRVEFIDKRNLLKEIASIYKGKDSSQCYYFNQFYVVPVMISYKKFNDNWPVECDRTYFDFKVENGPAVHFEYLRKAICL